MRGIVFTLAFDSSPIKGEGILSVGLSCFHPAPWIPAYAGMTVWWDCLAITLAFDSSPIKGEGIMAVGLDLLSPRPVDTALKPV